MPPPFSSSSSSSKSFSWSSSSSMSKSSSSSSISSSSSSMSSSSYSSSSSSISSSSSSSSISSYSIVRVIKIKGKLGHRFTPCDKCRWRNIVSHKVLFGNNTHAMFIRSHAFHANLLSGQGIYKPYIEDIGACKNFEPMF